MRASPLLTGLALLLATLGHGADTAKPGTKSESFDRDPAWEAHNNRIVPKEYPTIVQDFGYSKTNHAGKSPGEMGGQVWRASEPAYYAAKIGPKTLDDKLSASGTFALTKTTPGGGMFFGFFKAEQPGGGGRPIASLGMHMDCEHSGARLAVRLITGKNQSCGTFITPFIPGKFRPTPIKSDGTRYTWKLDYDPHASGGRGRFTFMISSAAHRPGELEKPDLPESHKQEARRRFPSTTRFSVDLPEGYKQQDTMFDHFGLMNMMKPAAARRFTSMTSTTTVALKTLPRIRTGTRAAIASRTRPATSAALTISASATRTMPAASLAKSAAPSGAPASTATTPTASAR